MVFFGTSTYSAEEAMDMMEEKGIKADALRLRAFPFDKKFEDFVANHKQVFVIEQNRDAQLRSMIMMELDTNPNKLISVLNYDGKPITANNIFGQISKVVSSKSQVARQ